MLGNTLTNVSMIVPPLVGLVASRRQGLELRYTVSYMLLLGEQFDLADSNIRSMDYLCSCSGRNWIRLFPWDTNV